MKNEIKRILDRENEISKIHRQLYEDKVNGVINESHFLSFRVRLYNTRNMMTNKGFTIFLLFLLTTLAFGCDGNETTNNDGDINFQDIVSLMSMSKADVFNWWDNNYEQVASGGERIEKYRDRNNNMCICFSDLENPDRVDSIEFEGAVDVNGVKIGLAYEDVKNILTEKYFEEEIRTKEGELVYLLWFFWDDFSVIFECDSNDETVTRIKIARSISLDSIKPLLIMSGKELEGYYGGYTYIGEDYDIYDECYFNMFFGFSIESRRGLDDIIYKKINQYGGFRVHINEIRVGTKSSEILESFGEPYYHGLFMGLTVGSDNSAPGGELLVYETNGGQICFYADKESGLCRMMEYRDWVENDFIKPDAKNKAEIFNFTDCEIAGIKLSYTEDQVQSINREILPTGDYGSSQKEYQDDSVDYIFSKGQNEWILTHIFLTTDKVEGPRGIKIGDSYKDVILRFYSNCDLEEILKDGQYLSLYDNGYQVRGYAWFNENNEITEIFYIYLDQDNAATLYFGIENRVVKAITLFSPLPGMPLMP